MALISIAIPVYNEEENIPRVYERITALAQSYAGRHEFEFVFTDNRSTDRSFALLDELSKADPRVRVLRFSRNYGYQRSILTGFFAARGDAVVQLDCDLEDPPELIAEFLKRWEEGYQVVYGVRKRRVEPWHKTVQRKIFYRVIDALSELPLPHDAGDFRLLDRRVVNELRKIYDASPYIRGAVAGMGFKQVGIDYSRNARVAGESKFSFRANLALAIDGILNHSIQPLRLSAVLGGVITLLSLLGAVGYVILKLVSNTDIPAGFTTLAILMMLNLGLNALFLGIIGEYLGRIYKQLKSGPLTILDVTCNVSDEERHSIENALSPR